ncbi:MAG: hypothetical protein IJ530_15450 [Treponema sp.]|uniref:hypothetical protein n=1 Tax=Treponema sp. TaxID=166 RepID=UPI0025D38C1F|nr:hypothetical protein [Treponema sp.]MBQ8681126.1 hypothetical protein [Treponema sp.]
MKITGLAMTGESCRAMTRCGEFGVTMRHEGLDGVLSLSYSTRANSSRVNSSEL